MPADPSLSRSRQDAIARLGLLERAGDPALSGLARVAAYVAGVGAAAVHVLDATQQHRIAATGAPLGPHPRRDAMCRLVVDGGEPIACADATADSRFSFSSFVRGATPVRCYVSFPLVTSQAVVIGTLCAWDTRSRELTADQLSRLEDLAAQAVDHLELLALARDLGHAASHDSLTGLPNRLVLADRLAQAFARRLRHGGEIAVALVDVDAFKTVNDTFGHDIGDEVLVRVATRLTHAVRVQDTVARLGGDEFAIVAEVPDAETADALMRRVTAALAEPTTVPGSGVRAGATLGWAIAAPTDDVRDALDRADRAMYAAKRPTA